MANLIILGNLLLALAIGAGIIYVGHSIVDNWWSLIVTIPIALSVLGGWANWVGEHWS